MLGSERDAHGSAGGQATEICCLADGIGVRCLRGERCQAGVIGTCTVSKLETPHTDGRAVCTPAPHHPQRRTIALKEPQSTSWSPHNAPHRGCLGQRALLSSPKKSIPNTVGAAWVNSWLSGLDFGNTNKNRHIVGRGIDKGDGMPDSRIEFMSIWDADTT
jgi:hypothetical protein